MNIHLGSKVPGRVAHYTGGREPMRILERSPNHKESFPYDDRDLEGNRGCR